MSPDEFQQAWRAESTQTRVTIDADLLLKKVLRSQRDFRSTILMRDYREVGIALLMIPLWFFLGMTFSLPWSWYLTVLAFIGVTGFTIVDRKRHQQKPSGPGESLRDSVQESLAQVEHQIWLLRNVVWWSLLPYFIPVVAFFAHAAWLRFGSNVIVAIIFGTSLSTFVLVLYVFVYFLNQRVVRKQLEPQRQELLALLGSLGDDATDEVSGEYPILMGGNRSTFSRRRLIVAGILFLVFLSIGIGGILIESRLGQDYPKISPFAAVSWKDSQPEVKVGDETYTLVSLDEIPAGEIVAFCKENFGDKWQKRFGEDLVEVLMGMGHKPGDTVRLVVLPSGSTTPKTLDDVPMTEDNRSSVRKLNQARERSVNREATRNSLSVEDAEAALKEMVPRLREENELVGLAAMVVIDGKVIATAIDGVRKMGSDAQLAIGDRWHLGSITKSITATMIARLVESEKMHWSDTIGSCFPDASIHEDWKAVTIRQLLTHTSGAPANFSFLTPLQKPARGPERTEARLKAVLRVLAKKPDYPPGEQHVYSNAGFTIAGTMAEQVTGETWEDLVQREVFDPLDLKDAGFGPPKSSNKTLEQPRGHNVLFGWKFAAGDEDDNTPIIGPAGIVHMTLDNLCTYAMEHMRGELGAGTLLSAETYKYLHTPELNRYACGWVKNDPGADIPHTVFWHNGSNTMWYALVVFIPDKNMVVAVTSNDGDRIKAEAAAWEIVGSNANGIDTGADPR